MPIRVISGQKSHLPAVSFFFAAKLNRDYRAGRQYLPGRSGSPQLNYANCQNMECCHASRHVICRYRSNLQFHPWRLNVASTGHTLHTKVVRHQCVRVVVANRGEALSGRQIKLYPVLCIHSTLVAHDYPESPEMLFTFQREDPANHYKFFCRDTFSCFLDAHQGGGF